MTALASSPSLQTTTSSRNAVVLQTHQRPTQPSTCFGFKHQPWHLKISTSMMRKRPGKHLSASLPTLSILPSNLCCKMQSAASWTHPHALANLPQPSLHRGVRPLRQELSPLSLRIPGELQLSCPASLDVIFADSISPCLGVPILFSQHQKQHKWSLPRLPTTLRREDNTVQGRHS